MNISNLGLKNGLKRKVKTQSKVEIMGKKVTIKNLLRVYMSVCFCMCDCQSVSKGVFFFFCTHNTQGWFPIHIHFFSRRGLQSLITHYYYISEATILIAPENT